MPKIINTANDNEKLILKLESAITNMIKHPSNGGAPFLFALTLDIPHEITTQHGIYPIETAGTNGIKFFWNPDFLANLSIKEIHIVMTHESYHVIFNHAINKYGYNYYVKSIANDYQVNAIIWNDYIKYNNIYPWGDNLGDPISLQDYICYLDGLQEFPIGLTCFADKKIIHISNKNIYKRILYHWEKSPRRCSYCNSLSLHPKTKKPLRIPSANGCHFCGAITESNHTLDVHLPIHKKNNIFDLYKAKKISDGLYSNSISPLIKEQLEIDDCTINIDLLKLINKFSNNIKDKIGNKNNWKKPKKRLLSQGIYLPSKKTHMPTWLCMIDSSGSMSKYDITLGLSILKLAALQTNGYVVQCDDKTYWDKIKKIEHCNGIKKLTILGRGSTNFNSFFLDFEKNIKTKIDIIIIITDGFCADIPISLKPKQQVIWALTSKINNFKPTFGTIISIK